MTGLRGLLHRLRGLFMKESLQQELEEEIRSHLEMQVEDYKQQGMNLDEARLAALRLSVTLISSSYSPGRIAISPPAHEAELFEAVSQLQRDPQYSDAADVVLE